MIFEAIQGSLSKVISKLRIFHPFYCCTGDPMVNLGISIEYKTRQCKYFSLPLVQLSHEAQLKQLIFGASLTDALRGLLVKENFACLTENSLHENT